MSMNLPNIKLKNVSKNISILQRRRINKLIAKEIKELNKHFNEDKWAIGFSYLKEEIIGDFFGGDISLYIMSQIIQSNKNLSIKVINGEFMIVDETYQPIYYNQKSDRIVLPNIDNYSSANYYNKANYINLGIL